MKIKLPRKFSEKYLDSFIDEVFKLYVSNQSETLHFDLQETEHIGNQELLVFTALLKSFIEAGIDFKVDFFEAGTPIDVFKQERVIKQIIQLWDVWKIGSLMRNEEIKKYFGIDYNLIQTLQRKLNYYPQLAEIYNRHGVTPFVSLDFVNNYNEHEVQKLIAPLYNLNKAINELLKRNNCHHPFTSNSLSSIVTEELFLNFLDHTISSSFPAFKRQAFLSISLQGKLDEEKYSLEEIQTIKRLNYETESIAEARDFFYDKKNGRFKNKPYIQFSFLDFGQGIVHTLQESYEKVFGSSSGRNFDSEILQYAFFHNSSRHEILFENEKIGNLIPRGLFDVLTIVRRYNGLLVVRSNYGKILYDFSVEKEISKAVKFFGDSEVLFPGTLISLYIPAIEDANSVNTSAIKPDFTFSKVKPVNKKYVNIASLTELVDRSKQNLYSKLLTELKKAICSSNDHSLVFVSFKGAKLEKRVIKKVLYFLLTDYDINTVNNVVVLNTPGDELIKEVAGEILALNEAIKNYKIHPLPIIEVDDDSQSINIQWLGVYNEEDKKKLYDLIYDHYSIAKTDFRDAANICGQLNEFDSFGNLMSNFPAREDILNFYKIENDLLISKQAEDLLNKYSHVRLDDGESLYLCNGNFYQKEYIELSSLLSDKQNCYSIANLLFQKLKLKLSNVKQYKFIGITTTSHKILRAFESQGLVSSDDFVALDNYHDFERDLTDELIDISKKYILVCDIFSTGYQTTKVNRRLLELGTNIEYIAVVTSTLDAEFEPTKIFLKEFENRIIFLKNYPIKKYWRKELIAEIITKKIIRINPHTNIPIGLSVNETNFDDSIIFPTSVEYLPEANQIIISNAFLDSIQDETLLIGFYKYNNIIHPYFFNTKIILKEINAKLLTEVFSKVKNSSLSNETVQVFYPRKSGVAAFDFSKLKSVLKNHAIEEIEIERFSTPEGWRFPHSTDYLSSKIVNNFCLILDDGSCSGDSLIQMIDEISFYDAKEIVLLCVIGRVNDHKREFFSRISSIKVRNGKVIPISIYFVCQWHIPTYYVDENPTTREVNWINDLLNLQNLPQSLKNIAGSIKREITPKSDVNYKDYKFLPRINKGEKSEIPKKELLLVREELGKVIGYRLYKESFKFFDCFMTKYLNRVKSIDRYKEIELLCATFIYEPYLFAKIVDVLPDVVERVEEFVKILVFGDSRIYEDLTYSWNKRDIIHLFFIVFKDDKLLVELTEENFLKIINLEPTTESTLNYTLYKLLQYFPIKAQQLPDRKFDVPLRDLLSKLKNGSSRWGKEIRKYHNFISTLPSREDFHAQLNFLVDNYNRQKEPEFHIEKKSLDHNISRIIVVIRECSFQLEKAQPFHRTQIDEIREIWFEILEFINPILRFASSFKEYLMPFPYFYLTNTIESGDKSVRGMVGFNESVIFSLSEQYNDIEKLYQLEKNVIKIQLDIKVDSIFHQLISKPYTDLNELVNGIKKELESLPNPIKLEGEEKLKGYQFLTRIPEIYSDVLIKKELITNLKNHSDKDPSSPIRIECSIVHDFAFQFKLINAISKHTHSTSNGEGIKCLNLLSDSPLFDFKYSSKQVDGNFFQTLTFNSNGNGYQKN